MCKVPQNDENPGCGHVPVLRDEVETYLCKPLLAKESPVYIDCTLGLGGHTRAILEKAPNARAIVMDVDERNVLLAKDNLGDLAGRIRFFHANFASIREVFSEAEIEKADALLADIGFASNQMDDPGRGMSFLAEGPLDMRLDTTQGTTAADLVNSMNEKPLADLIYQYGEERHSRRIAKAILAARELGEISTTAHLAEIITRAMPHSARRGRIHPATRTFQALRIGVNEELSNLDELLTALPELMNPGARAAIISFHSLEDRKVKQAFTAMANTGRVNILTKKPITPTPREISKNPRSRSAKMRVAEFL